MAEDLGAACIVTFSRTGRTARFMSKYQPALPILGVTTELRTHRRMCLYRGVVPVLVAPQERSEQLVGLAEAEILRDGKATATRYMYVWERGDWRWDMERTFQISDRVLRMRASHKRQSGEEYLLTLLETETGRKVPGS